jgi:hypothetical protein
MQAMGLLGETQQSAVMLPLRKLAAPLPALSGSTKQQLIIIIIIIIPSIRPSSSSVSARLKTFHGARAKIAWAHYISSEWS